MIEKTIETVIAATVLGKTLYAMPIMIMAGIFLFAVLKTIPNTTKKDNVISLSLLLSEGFFFYALLKYDFSITSIKYLVLICILAYASVYDIKTRSVPNYIAPMIAIVGLIDINEKKILINLATACFVLLFMTAISILCDYKLGAGDIKFLSAIAFVSGPIYSVTTVIIGFALSVVGTILRNKITKSNNKSLALLPYLSAGCLLCGMI